MADPVKILFLTNIPSPYQVDFFRALSREKTLRIRALFCTRSEPGRAFTVPDDLGFDGRILCGHNPSFMPSDWSYVPGLVETLERARPMDLAVVSGSYVMPAARVARRWLTRTGIPWLFWGEDPWKKNRGTLERAIKRAYLTWFLRPAIGAMGVGGRAVVSFQALMGPKRAYLNLPYAPELAQLIDPSEEQKERALKLRASWDIDDPLVIVFCGALSQRKAPDLLLRAFAACIKSIPKLRLMFVGDGPMRSELHVLAQELGVIKRTRFLGFVEGAALHVAYLSADLFVLPTRTHEGWGVVVQEALAAGLPVILSDIVASGYDLIDRDIAGGRFASDDCQALIERISSTALSTEMLSQCARLQRKTLVQQWGCCAAAESFTKFACDIV